MNFVRIDFFGNIGEVLGMFFIFFDKHNLKGHFSGIDFSEFFQGRYDFIEGYDFDRAIDLSKKLLRRSVEFCKYEIGKREFLLNILPVEKGGVGYYGYFFITTIFFNFTDHYAEIFGKRRFATS